VATSRTRWVPPVLKAWHYLCCVSGGNPRPFACGFGSAWFYARQQERRPASFAGLLPCAGRCEDGSRSGTDEVFSVLTTHRNPAPARIASCCVPRCCWDSRYCVQLHGACQRLLLARDVLVHAAKEAYVRKLVVVVSRCPQVRRSKRVMAWFRHLLPVCPIIYPQSLAELPTIARYSIQSYLRPVNGNFPPAGVQRLTGHIVSKASSAHPQKG
jgi:hypothetical protein